RYLDHRRDVTARLRVLGPQYVPVHVYVTVRIWHRAIDEGLIALASDAVAEISDNIEAFLHPIHGGKDGSGWKVGQHLFIADIFNAIKPPDQIGYIEALTLSA